MKKNNHKTSDEWFKIGEDEFKFAKVNLEEFNAFYPQICFYFQQAVEKYLKGFLVFHNKKFKKVHNLNYLLILSGKIDHDFLDYFEETNYLTQFYFIARYPIVNYPPASEKEARQSLKYAESLIGFVKKKIKYFNN